MARPIPAKFYVNSGIVSSRTDILNLLRPLQKQTVAYRYYRGRDLVAHGTGWVERVVIDEPETSSYFTPVSICLNVDSFEHLEFETRPDQLIVYTLVEGDERIILEFAPLGEAGRTAAGAAGVRHERLRPDGAAGPRGGPGRLTSRRPPATGPPGRAEPRLRRAAPAPAPLLPALAPHVGDAQRRRGAQSLAHRLAGDGDEDHDHEDVRQHLEEEREGVVLEERVGEPEQRIRAPGGR